MYLHDYGDFRYSRQDQQVTHIEVENPTEITIHSTYYLLLVILSGRLGGVSHILFLLW